MADSSMNTTAYMKHNKNRQETSIHIHKSLAAKVYVGNGCRKKFPSNQSGRAELESEGTGESESLKLNRIRLLFSIFAKTLKS